MIHPIASLCVILFLLFVMPVWGWLDMRRLKRERTDIALTRTYVITIGVMWLLAALCAVLLPYPVIWTAPVGLATRMRLDLVPAGGIIGVVVGLLIGLCVPAIAARRHPEAVRRQLEPLRFMLPSTRAQRWLFALVCLTAGICEEWIYRGFVLHVLTAQLPSVNVWWLLLIQAVMFGIAHVYQGRAGTLLTGVLGLILGLLYIATGSLLLSMILHALIDLRVFLLLPVLRAPSTPTTA